MQVALPGSLIFAGFPPPSTVERAGGGGAFSLPGLGRTATGRIVRG